MALLASEVQRIRYELGYNVLNVGAEPYVSIVAIFNQIIQTHLNAGASTTSATVVTVATAPTPITLALASATGFAAGDRVVIDVDERQEIATVQSLAAPAITLLLTGAHTGVYPVCVEGGETIVREILAKLRTIDTSQGDTAIVAAGIKRADEIEFFGGKDGRDVAGSAASQREYWRRELADALGVQYLRAIRRGSGSSGVELY